MIEPIIELVLDESKWLPTAVFLSLLSIVVWVARKRSEQLPRRVEVQWAMNLFYACMIGIMAAGHLLAVSIKLVQGTLEGSPWFLVPLGFVLAIPAGWLALLAGRFPEDEERAGPRALGLNGWLAASLIALGLHNIPLAVPAALNIAFQLHSRRFVGWTIGTVTVGFYLTLLVGSVAFFLSGQSFEEFRGLE